ncbi:1-acyl-sn-glycerol-3-phosphate acyltransferases [Polaribacter sp. Hel1_33_78]|jgi:1-acyl-sn-glycerol-3-phosphate acyltransferase|uniref:1-acyl-sn-glycerol-3-phosphate acyltransferase n=1 Tax=unclassified Polaribacter TaxID=196858 RepID=UPI00052E1AC7|nr:MULTISPECIES: 1-acyl-sn-glycerol-3-phosphate acyltransferase [unclassified Polaribacter]KGL61009.1 acyltransferase [Polaribacter sp. Hel1_33_49]MBT4413724.1 acyltransferase [Polaribacter sp.]MDG1195776.1 1-acyl-sn-glycerol-3-phosphate acyltransferase [Polaribacter sp.]MDG1404464.1 1-acyl-sn-glycerol-3-phosphate acyltransferase [Polaribacter sp.]MDG2437643.1 1-acyl-sn-glycerol-3-phosphate acyltransferase [Polaribacter sp.]
MKGFARFILFSILGWKLEGDFSKEIKKYVVIAAPHTSWIDFPIAILARMASGTMIHFIGKNSLFNGPFGFFFRALGGTPVDRSKSNNLVDAIVQIFNSKSKFILGLSPEGTRKKVEKWKTGFYFIAKGAKVPIVMATLDFENKKIKISEPYYPTDDQEKDFKFFYSFYENVKGKKPELS